jgi:transcriptional regulator with XRE-family HTH domain
MEQQGFTQRELAGMVGVTESAMSRYLKDEREPKLDVIANLATALKTTTNYLITGEDTSSDSINLYQLVARSSSSMSSDQKMELIRLLSK